MRDIRHSAFVIVMAACFAFGVCTRVSSVERLPIAELAAVPQSGRVMLAWDPNPASEQVFGYTIGYRTDREGPETLVNAGPVTLFTLTGLADGRLHIFRVYAENITGRGPASNEVSTTTQPADAPVPRAPGAPTIAPFDPFSQPVRINFQPAGSVVPPGFLVDSGAVFGPRGNGYSYGWNADTGATARERDATNSPDQQRDTLIHLQRPENPDAIWEIALPNGTYDVGMSAGDPGFFDSVYRITAEGVLVINGTPTSGARWVEAIAPVTVSDGRLTIRSGTGSVNNKLCFVTITKR